MSEKNRSFVENLRIHELRDFARKMGVASPTTLNKELLIDFVVERMDEDDRKKSEAVDESSNIENKKDNDNNIVSILSNEKSSNVNESEEYVNDEDYSVNLENTINTDEVSDEYPTEEPIDYTIKVGQNYATYNVGDEDVTGIVSMRPDGYAIVRNEDYIPTNYDPFITQSIVTKFSLQDGLKIRGKVKYIYDDKPKIMYEVLYVEQKKNPMINFDQFECGAIGGSISLKKFAFKINKGERVYIKNLSFKDTINLACDIVDNNLTNAKVIHIKSMPDGITYTKNGLEVITCLFNKTDMQILDAVELVMKRIKREFENKVPNVLIIYNFGELIRSFNTAIQGFYEIGKFDAKALNRINSVLAMAKYIDEKMNVSVVCIDKGNISSDIQSLMDSYFLPYFNKLYTK